MAIADDPRAENCRCVATDQAGRVVGVELAVDVRPGTRYELARVDLIDEVAAMGNTVATCTVLDRNGLELSERVYLAWPWPSIENRALPGNQNGQHPITNGYRPPELGPLALYVGDAAGQVLSDVVGGLGLPWNRHVSFRATWRERVADAPDGPAEPDVPEDPEYDEFLGLMGAGLVALERCAGALERLATHLGA